jgi:hypothetical protein
MYYVVRGFLSQENYFGVGNELANLPTRLNSIQTGETDIEQNQIRAKLRSLLDCG